MKFDLYLRGDKGLAAMAALREHGEKVSQVFVRKNSGLASDPFEQILALSRQSGIDSVSWSARSRTRNARKKVALVVGWDLLIDYKYLNVLVIHDSLLPELRGWNPLVTALILGMHKTGATLFEASTTGGYDDGDILSQVEIQLEPLSYVSKAMQEMNKAVSLLAVEAVTNYPSLIDKKWSQRHDQATLSIWRDDEDYRIDWHSTAETVVRKIRAISVPYAGAFFVFEGRRIRVFEAELADGPPPSALSDPGKLLAYDGTSALVTTMSQPVKISSMFEDISGNAFAFGRLRSRLSGPST